MSKVTIPNAPEKFRIVKEGAGLVRRVPFTSDGIPTHGVTFAKWTTGFAVVDTAGKWLAVTPDVDDTTASNVARVLFGKRAFTVDAYNIDGNTVGFFATIATKKGN